MLNYFHIEYIYIVLILYAGIFILSREYIKLYEQNIRVI